MKLMIAGGGTGGHLYIGIALARELQRRDPRHDVLFVGTRRGLEARIVPGHGFRLELITSGGLKGMGLWRLVRNAMMIPRSLLQSWQLVRAYAPQAVVGVGGYSSGPVVLAAWWSGKPTLIVEPNAFPGLANRWLARVVDCAALALPDRGNHFGSRAVVTGIPVRREFREIPRRCHEAGKLHLLIYGGSQGSRALNEIVCRALPELRALGAGLRICHQTGEQELEAVRSAYLEAGVQADVRAFLPRIYEDLARADLVMCRAGAGTIAELTVAGKAALLVPFPGAADDHQVKNAMALQEHGAARMIREPEWTAQRLAREISHYMDHPEELDRMEEAARRLARPAAAEQIADLLLGLAGNSGARPPAAP